MSLPKIDISEVADKFAELNPLVLSDDKCELTSSEILKAQIREMRNLQIEITPRKLRKYLKLSKQINETVRLLYEID
ncbi:MAG: hypothetical protein IJX24_04810 [Oscillospiraceae bacterium]|nr:hypothetical protein [Oscillospiraceae bacterium]